jgi:6-phosphogluconolactonase/glucosamine-6-phosphate isomerase/deaminase
VAAGQLEQLLKLHIDKPLLLLVSGGSALVLLERIQSEALGRHITVALLDERWSEDPQINNCAQLMATDFYTRVVAVGGTVFDSRPRLHEPAVALAARYEDFLRTWYRAHPQGVAIATLGMGADGHTVGIFPGYVAALNVAGKWVEAYTLAPEVNPYPERVTVTPQFLTTKINHAVAYVVGKDKHPVLATLTANPDTDPELLPATLWYQIPQVTVTIDRGDI